MRVLGVLGRCCVVTVLLFGCFASAVRAANGDLGSNGGSDGGVSGDGQVFVAVSGVQHGRGPLVVGGADSSGCFWVREGNGLVDDAFFDVVKVVGGVSYHGFLRQCPGLVATVHWIPQVSAAQLGGQAAQDVRERLPKPVVGAAPPVSKGVVKVGMWFWTDPAGFVSVSASAWVPVPGGVLVASATAVPVRLVFDSGEPGGRKVVCEGPGRVWAPVDGDVLVSSCMYTFLHSSAVSASGVFSARLSIVWRVSWTANDGAGGDLGEYTTFTSEQITVNEIQALITY